MELLTEKCARDVERAKREPRLRIIRAADTLFRKKGVKATSMRDVMKASRTNSGQFCYCFRNKRLLVHAVLQTYVQSVALGNGDMDSELKSWEEVEQCLLRLISFQRGTRMARGCPLGSLGSEVGEGDELIRCDVSRFLEAKTRRLAEFFEREKEKGNLSRKTDSRGMADFFVAVVQGAMLIGKISRDYRRVETIFGETLLHLRGSSARPHHRNKQIGFRHVESGGGKSSTNDRGCSCQKQRTSLDIPVLTREADVPSKQMAG